MTVRWSALKSNGGLPITGYEYRVQIDNGPFSIPAPLVIGNTRTAALPCSAPGAAGHGCKFEVRATNGTPGPWSVAVGADWLAPSVALLGRTLAGPAVGAATLSWRPPKTTGGLAVEYQYQVNAGSGWSTPATIDPGLISLVSGSLRPVYTATLPCAITVPVQGVKGCSYTLTAVNGVGAAPVSKSRTGVLRRPGPSTDLQIFTSSVALGTGLASQSISWTSPTDVGGLPLLENVVSACATALGSQCSNLSPGWAQIADLLGTPPPTSTTSLCPSNGSCAYEVWTKNAVGKGWVIGTPTLNVPTHLTAAANPATPGHVDLQWLNVVDPGTTFGNYVVFECGAPSACTSGAWTSVPADLGPWTRTDLVGTATSTSYPCSTVNACTFRIGYLDAAGNIGGVSNAVTLVAS